MGPFPPGRDPPKAVCASHPYSKGEDCRFPQSPFCPSWPPPAPPQGCRTALPSPVLQSCTLVDLATAGPDWSGRSIFCTDGQSSGLKPSFHQPLPRYPCRQPGSSLGGPASSLSVKDPDSLGSGLPKEKTLPAPPPLSMLGTLEQSPGQYLSPPPLQSPRVFFHLPPEKVEPLWPLDPPWAS